MIIILRLVCMTLKILCKWGIDYFCWWLSFCRCSDSKWVNDCILPLL